MIQKVPRCAVCSLVLNLLTQVGAISSVQLCPTIRTFRSEGGYCVPGRSRLPNLSCWLETVRNITSTAGVLYDRV